MGAGITVQAQVPHVMNYQGRLMDGGNPASGVYAITFTLHTRASGGNEVWREPHEVTVVDGVFNVLLGTTVPMSPDVLAGRDSLYLSMRIADVELTPRLLLASTPFAIRAAEAESVADDAAVLSLNGMQGILTLREGSNISITEDEGTITISAAGGSTGSGAITSVLPGTGLTGGGAGGDVTLSLADGGVVESKLANGAVTTTKIGDGAVTRAKLAPDGLVTSVNNLGGDIQIRAAGGATITSDDNIITITAGSGGGGTGIQGVQNTDGALQIANPSGPTATVNVASGGIKTAMLAANAVSAEKIADGAVESKKLADGVVSSAKLADEAVGTAKLASGAVDATRLANNAVTTEKLTNDAVSSDKLATGAVTTTKIGDGAVDATKLATNAAVLSLNGQRGAVAIEGGDNISVTQAAGTITITATGVGTGNITAVESGPGLSGGGTSGVVTLSLANEGVTTVHLLDGTVGAADLAPNSVDDTKLVDGAVTGAKIATSTITDVHLADGVITSEKLADGVAVISLNGEVGEVNLLPGSNIQIDSDNNGNITISTADTPTSAALPSSIRWKEDVHTIEDAAAIVEQLRGVRYVWKEDGREDIGLIAEEVGKVMPEVVEYEANGVDARAVNYAKLVAVLIEAVKQQRHQLDIQQQQREADRTMVQELLSRVAQLEARAQSPSAHLGNGDGIVNTH